MSSSPHNSPPPDDWNDHSIELIIGTLLRVGVLLSASVVLIGGIIYLFRHGLATASYRTFEGDLSPLRSLPGITHGVLQLSGRAIIQLGLLLLIATPVARVVFSAVALRESAITSTSPLPSLSSQSSPTVCLEHT